MIRIPYYARRLYIAGTLLPIESIVNGFNTTVTMKEKHQIVDRQVMYAYDSAAGRLQRVLEVVERPRR